MALSKEWTTCVRCKGTPPARCEFRYLGEGAVCAVCAPPEPEITFSWRPGYDTDAAFIVTANVREYKKCENCGYLWGTLGRSFLSFKDLEEHGMRGFYLSEIQHSPREIVESKRQAARNKALEHFNKPMPTCKKCAKPGSNL